MSDKKVFCVMPAYNEEKNISQTIEGVAPRFDSLVVVVDGGTDSTYLRALEMKQKLSKINSNIFVLKHKINRGQGAALETGNLFSIKMGADMVVHFDADGQFLADEIPDLLLPVEKENFDIVFGSRFLGKDSNMPFFKKHIIMRLGRLANKIFLGLQLSDPQNGFRVMSKRALELIRIEQDGSAHCSEILAKTSKYNLKFREVPVTVKYFDFGQGLFSGKGRGKGGLVILKDLFLAKFIN